MKATLLAGVVAVAVVAPLGYNIHRSYQMKLRATDDRITQEQALQRTQADITATIQSMDRYRSRLPTEPNTSWLVNDAVKISEQANLQLSTVTQAAPQVLPQFTHLSIEIELTTSYHQLGDFLDRLERAEHFIQVEHLDILSKDERSGKARMRLSLGTIYLPPTADLLRSN